MKSMFLLAVMALSCVSVAAEIEEGDVDKDTPPVLEYYSVSKVEKSGFTQGEYANDKALYCGPRIDFSEHVVDASCVRKPGDNAPFFVFIFLDEPGGEKLKELTEESVGQFVAIDVNGESAGITKIEVVHKPVNFRKQKCGLLTFSVGQDWKKGEEFAKAINMARD